MDYEKAYKALVAKVKNAHLYAQTDSTKNVLENILPELRESDDERIRKELWEYFHELELSSDRDFSPSFTFDDILAWLEKQKEQPKLKPMNIPSGGGRMGTPPPKFKLDVKPEQPVEGRLEMAARHVWESWNGGTMDDVRRDMEELGAVLKERKEVVPEQPAEGLEEEISRTYHDGSVTDTEDIDHVAYENIARHFAEWGASHATAPYYFKLRDIKTGRVFLAEWSDIAGEWYERGNGKAHQSDKVEILKRDQKTPTP